MKNMFAVFTGIADDEVIVCPVGSDGTPLTGDYFEGDQRSRADYELTLTDKPIRISSLPRVDF